MKPIRTFFVEPNLPEQLKILKDLAYNVRWTWDAPTRELFRRIDADLLEACGENPVKMLGQVDASRFLMLEQDESFLYHLRQVEESYREYIKGDNSWFRKTHPEVDETIVAYFSAEFGITDCIQIFSGGLGILAGDHLKSASDMGIPMIGVGLLYQEGYFHQYLNQEGWQQETYPVNDFHTMPMFRVRDEAGHQIAIDVPFPGRVVKAYIWEVQVGRVPLFLLDTNHPENSPADCRITGQLYGGDQEMRIQQEIVLGMGGVLMLQRLGIEPPILHTNEGHAAFLTLERIRQLMKKRGLSFADAREACVSSVLFTTHTPVPAGIDVFPRHMVEHYFGHYCSDIGIAMDELLDLGRNPMSGDSNGFNMAVLAVRLSYGTNAVSKLHRDTTRRMWKELWPGVPVSETPIGSVTNGIHIPSWISHELGTLLDRYLGPKWREDPRDRLLWERVDQVPSEELWRTHERRRERLVAFCRYRGKEQAARNGASPSRVQAALEVLDPEALTIGFARRFAPYKRAALLFRDIDRLVKILSDKNRPVQILFAGKAHPRDHFGKEIIRTIVAHSRRPDIARRIVFLENYDMKIARYLVQGVDVWLNTPRRPKEASGTSGMKAVANGALHFSTRDGWWAEVEADGLGWNIGAGEEYPEDQHDYQDEVEARSLYDILEHEVVPTFFHRGKDDIPRQWIAMMKKSLKTLPPVFNTNRMVRQYAERYYLPAVHHFVGMSDNDFHSLKVLSEWKQKVAQNWYPITLKRVDADIESDVLVGETGNVVAVLELGALAPEDVTVEVVYGRIGPDFQIDEAGAVPMSFEGREDSAAVFKGIVPCIRSGKFGFALRLLPRHSDLANPYQTGLIKIFGG